MIGLLVVDENLVALNVNLPHPGITADDIHDLIRRVGHFQDNVVQERLLWRPGYGFFNIQDERRAVQCRTFGLIDRLPASLHTGAEGLATFKSVKTRGNHKPFAIQIRYDLDVLQPMFIDGLHPNRLPYSRGASIMATARLEVPALLTGWLFVGPQVVGHAQNHVVRIADLDEPGDIETERYRASEVHPHRFAVDE